MHTVSPFSQVLHEAIENKVTMNACKHTQEFRMHTQQKQNKTKILTNIFIAALCSRVCKTISAKFSLAKAGGDQVSL
jgi:hypothetical protein